MGKRRIEELVFSFFSFLVNFLFWTMGVMVMGGGEKKRENELEGGGLVMREV